MPGLSATIFKFVSGGLAILCIALGISLAVEKHRTKSLKSQVERCIEGREADRQSYARAQAEAEAANLRKVREIEQRQEAINDETTRNLNARLERLRRELRQQGTSPAAGSASGAGISENGPPSSGVDEAPRVCLAPSELLRAAENEERHDQLINWIERQLKVTR